jgi:hypothetical protein
VSWPLCSNRTIAAFLSRALNDPEYTTQAPRIAGFRIMLGVPLMLGSGDSSGLPVWNRVCSATLRKSFGLRCAREKFRAVPERAVSKTDGALNQSQASYFSLIVSRAAATTSGGSA